MGQKGTKKNKQIAQTFTQTHGIGFIEALDFVSIECVLEIGERIASTDYAVYHYKNKKHPQFYKNDDNLKKAVRRSFSMGAFEHRQQAIDILESHLPNAFFEIN